MIWQELLTIILTSIASIAAVTGIIYTFLRNFKIDIQKEIQELKGRQDIQDDRMFLLSTGKSLTDAIKEVRIKKEEMETKKD